MTQTYLWRFPVICLYITLFLVVSFLRFSVCPALAQDTGISSYDASKFELIPVNNNFPQFIVEDARPEKQALFNVKRKIIPPVKYFTDGIQSTIAQSSSTVLEDAKQLKFIIKDFRIVFEKKPKFERKSNSDLGDLISTIEVDVLISEDGNTDEIGNYKSISFNQVNDLSSGVPTSDLQNVLDRNFHKLLMDIFSSEAFTGVLNKKL